MPQGPANTTTSGEEFFRTEGTYTSLGAPIPGGQVARWLVREGQRIESIVEMFDELCWRLVGDGVPLWRAVLHTGTLHPQIGGIGARWLRERNSIERYRTLLGSEGAEEYLRSPIRATIERGTPFRRRLIEDAPEYPLLSKMRSAGATDYFALALNRTYRRFPVVTWATDRPSGFTRGGDRRARRDQSGSRHDRRDARDPPDHRQSARHLSGPLAGRRVLAGQIQRAVGERLHAVIMMTDMRCFTALSDRLPGEEVIELLDDYFDAIVTPVEARKGETLKFIGDGARSIFFPAADDSDFSEASIQALEAALEGLERLGRVNKARRENTEEFRRLFCAAALAVAGV